jgi:hypothetical protein
MVVFPLVLHLSNRPLTFIGNALISKRMPHIDNNIVRCQTHTLSLASKDSTADRIMNHSSLSLRIWNALDLEEYLHEIMTFAMPNDEKTLPFQLSLNEKHRAKMMRAIMGMSKLEFKNELRRLQSQQQWEQADAFLRQDLQPLMERVDAEQAPNFAPTIQLYLDSSQTTQQTQQSCHKFFATLARGRIYQGKLERILQLVAPHLLPMYQQIIDDVPQADLLRLFVENQKSRCISDENTYLLQQCLDMSFVQAPPESMDGGKAKGKRGEVDLTSYLRERYQHDSNYRVLAPVWVRPFSNHQYINNKNKCQYELQIPSEFITSGMTSEYDAMIVRMTEGDSDGSTTLTIHEVWDAKATLDPAAMYDILRKKVSSLEMILVSTNVLPHAKFVFANDKMDSLGVFSVQVGGSSEHTPGISSTGTPFPKIGLFTSCLPTPRAAARRLQTTVCEVLLESDREWVRQVIEANTGKISPPGDKVEQYARRILQLVQKVQPIVVLSDTVNGAHQ